MSNNPPYNLVVSGVPTENLAVSYRVYTTFVTTIDKRRKTSFEQGSVVIEEKRGDEGAMGSIVISEVNNLSNLLIRGRDNSVLFTNRSSDS